MSTAEPKNEKTITELPLRAMDYSGNIEGAVAELELQLKYENKLARPLEPIFTFPLPAEATIMGVTVKIGNRTIQSELKKAAEAKQDYEQAVNAGHHASLLEQHRDNIFTMSVGGIEPNEQIDVTVRYNHPVDWQSGGGRFILPLVVAPHFIHGNPLERSQGSGFSPDTDKVPDASRITPVVAGDPDQITYRASLTLQLNPGFESRVACPSHDALFSARELKAGERLKIELKDLRPDRDFTLTYQSEEKLPQIKADKGSWQAAGGSKEEFLLLQLVPAAKAPKTQREVVLCLDCSGSMDGLAIAGLRRVAEKVLKSLSAGRNTKVGIIKFNDAPELLQDLQAVDQDQKFDRALSRLRASGGTRAGLALDAACSLFGSGENASAERSIIFITDGDTSDVQVARARPGIRIHSVGLGSAVDHAVLKTLARETGGSTYWVYPGEDYDTAAREIVARTNGPVMRNLKIEGLPADAEVVGLQDLYAGHPVTIAVRTNGTFSGRNLLVKGENVSGKTVSCDLKTPPAGDTVNFAHTLWARLRMRGQLDEQVLTALSLKYGVLARTTAFVAVLLKERPGQKPERLEIPVSLPHGWEMEQGWGMSHAMLAGAAPVRARAMAGGGGVKFGYCASLAPANAGPVLFRMSKAARASQPPDLQALNPQPLLPALPDLLSKSRQLLEGLKQGQVDEKAASMFWKEITRELEKQSQSHFSGWQEEHKAELYVTLSALRGYGLKAQIPADLRSRPAGQGLAAELWRRAERLLGIQR